MKIGLFSSWIENLSLVNILKHYNNDIFVYMDQDARPFEDKSLEFQQKYIKKAIKIFLEKWVEKIILPPVWELKFKNEKYIFPLYQNILKQNLKYSLVWKIWLLGQENDLDFVKTYLLNQNDYLKIYKKDVSLWKYNIINLNKRNWMLRKIIKTDLNYFFNCNVDTLIPTTYSIYHFENILNQKIKKIRFQNIKSWCFLDELFDKKNNQYKIDIIENWNTNYFLKHKKWNSLFN